MKFEEMNINSYFLIGGIVLLGVVAFSTTLTGDIDKSKSLLNIKSFNIGGGKVYPVKPKCLNEIDILSSEYMNKITNEYNKKLTLDVIRTAREAVQNS
jgi:hypothetical protein